MSPEQDIRAKRTQLFDGIAARVHAAEWLWAYGFFPPEDIRPRNLDYQIGGEARWSTGFWHTLRAFGIPSPPLENARIVDRLRKGEHFTSSLVQLLGKDLCNSPRNRRHVQRCRLDDIAYSLFPHEVVAGHIFFSGVALGRRVGMPDFTLEDLQDIHSSVALPWLAAEGLERRRHFEGVRRLPRRLWMIYAGLIGGHKPSEIRQVLSDFKREISQSDRIKRQGIAKSTVDSDIKNVRSILDVDSRQDL